MRDLRSWIDGTPEVVRVPEPVSVRHEVTAVQHAIENLSRAPLLFEQPILLDGRISPMPVLTNVTARRDLLTRVLGLPERRTAAPLSARLSRPIAPERVGPRKDRTIVANPSDVLPALWQHDCDPGPYLTAAHATTIDPETLIDNTAVQRVWVKPGQEWPYFPYPSSHNWKNIEKWWARGEDAPIALWIGHHPAVLMGSQVKLGYPASHWPSAGALLGEPLRLMETILHGSRIPVPAEAEIVIEGFVPKDLRVDEGPFGEFTGYAGEGTKSPFHSRRTRVDARQRRLPRLRLRPLGRPRARQSPDRSEAPRDHGSRDSRCPRRSRALVRPQVLGLRRDPAALARTRAHAAQ